MPSLQVIVASTRPGRIGLPIGQWAYRRASGHGGFDVELVDLAEQNLPFMDEPNHPRLRRYVHEHTKAWSAKVDAADAFVFVTPEYNFGYPATLKNAVDFLFQEWATKPCGLFSYGGVAAGTRSAQLVKPVLGAVGLVVVPEAVAVPFAGKLVSDGDFHPTEAVESSTDAMLDSLVRWSTTLSPMRRAEQD
ncbi:NAD(P)H-dependent oxidoreductase [Pilimelia columellifera]|uniref:NADPH-dependent FMN reductase n=1 Tax=Pilimelia columellifera subsp. columellifera TaxID=706583 RepID=A0ABP6A9F8_9ACTN